MDSNSESSESQTAETPSESSQLEPAVNWDEVPVTEVETEEYNPQETSEANKE